VQVVFVPFEGKTDAGPRVGIAGIQVILARNASGVSVENTGTGEAVVGSELTGSELKRAEATGSEAIDCVSSRPYVLDGSTVIGSDVTGVYSVAGVVVLGGGSFVVGSAVVESTEGEVIGGSLVVSVVVELLSLAPSGTASAFLPPSTGTVS